MVPYVRDQGAIRGSLPSAPKPGQPKSTAFHRPHEADQGWRDWAACASSNDPDLWFPVGNTGWALLQIEDAKEVCRRCPSIDACLSWALDAGMDHGVWG